MEMYDFKYKLLETHDGNRQVFALEPLPRGFGHTLGNSLRRVLLGHLSGAAITQVKIDGVSHEFSTIRGVQEDVVEILQQLKLINFEVNQPKTHIITLDVSGENTVTAGDLHCPTGIEVVNKDLHIATLSDKKSELKMELTVEYGSGYRLPEETEKRPVGVIIVDANFSPIELATYTVESTRVGRNTDLDRLVMDITTNGAMTPEEALQQSSAILVEYFAKLAGDTKVYVYEEIKEESTAPAANAAEEEVYLEELNLPTRVLNTLKKSGYETIEDIRKAGEEGLRSVKNIGPKTVDMLLEKAQEKSE